LLPERRRRRRHASRSAKSPASRRALARAFRRRLVTEPASIHSTAVRVAFVDTVSRRSHHRQPAQQQQPRPTDDVILYVIGDVIAITSRPRHTLGLTSPSAAMPRNERNERPSRSAGWPGPCYVEMKRPRPTGRLLNAASTAAVPAINYTTVCLSLSPRRQCRRRRCCCCC